MEKKDKIIASLQALKREYVATDVDEACVRSIDRTILIIRKNGLDAAIVDTRNAKETKYKESEGGLGPDNWLYFKFHRRVLDNVGRSSGRSSNFCY